MADPMFSSTTSAELQLSPNARSRELRHTRELLREHRRPAMIIVMGVSGCGKSTIGQGLADRLGVRFKDGDELHLENSIAKMSRGEPLTDADRWPWLERIRETARDMTVRDGTAEAPTNRPIVVIACSALRRDYRDLLRGVVREHTEHVVEEGVQAFFLYLRGTQELLFDRMHKRQNHFMKESMLQSQIDTLEEPAADEDDYGGVMQIELSNDVKSEAAVRAHLDLAGASRPAPPTTAS